MMKSSAEFGKKWWNKIHYSRATFQILVGKVMNGQAISNSDNNKED